MHKLIPASFTPRFYTSKHSEKNSVKSMILLIILTDLTFKSHPTSRLFLLRTCRPSTKKFNFIKKNKTIFIYLKEI